jgi:hypothetical protein
LFVEEDQQCDVGGWVVVTFQTSSLDIVNSCNKQTNITNLCVQTADDLEPLLENMAANTGVSTDTLVSSSGQQKGAKLPQYAAAVSGNVGKNNFAEIHLMV